MVKTPHDVFKIMEQHCVFGEGTVDTINMHDNIISPLRECAELAGTVWTYDEGASKLAIMFPDLGFVIKVPYTGRWEDDGEEPCDDCSKRDECDGCQWDCARRRHWDETHDEYKDYFEFNGAGVFCEAETNIDMHLDNNWDYCAVERYLTRAAVAAEVSECLASVTLLGTIEEHPIYVQPYATIYSDYYTSTRKSHSKEEKITTEEACRRVDGWCFNVDWLTDFLVYYGDETFQKFMAFIKKYEIRDLHDGNVGYIDGAPVLVDFGGFCS